MSSIREKLQLPKSVILADCSFSVKSLPYYIEALIDKTRFDSRPQKKAAALIASNPFHTLT